MAEMNEWLRACAENFGPPPRKLSWWTRQTYFRVPPPQWLREFPTDKMMVVFENLRPLFAHGTVVWGATVQANRHIYEPGTEDTGGDVVYSLEYAHRFHPQHLVEIARRLFELKNTTPKDPELAPIAAHLTDEYTRVFGVPVPSSISPKLRCMMTTTFYPRKHLPGRRLSPRLYPIVASRTEPHVAMPLPERYWPQELVDWWLQPD